MKPRALSLVFLAFVSSSMAPSGSIHSARRFFEGLPASIVGTASSPTFSITQNSTMSIASNGGAPVTIAFDTFYGTSTPGADVVAEINADLASAGLNDPVASFSVNRVILTSVLVGPQASIKVTDGVNSPAATLGLSTTLTFGGKIPATQSTELNRLVDNVSDYVLGDKILVSGIHPDGFLIASQFDYGAFNDGTTLGDLIDFLNGPMIFDASSSSGATAAITGRGHIGIFPNSGGASQLSLTIADDLANFGHTLWAYHPFIP